MEVSHRHYNVGHQRKDIVYFNIEGRFRLAFVAKKLDEREQKTTLLAQGGFLAG